MQDRTDTDEPNPNPTLENIEEDINLEMIKRHGKSVQNEPLSFELFMRHNEATDTFSFAIKNLRNQPASFTLDCSESQNMLFSEAEGKATRYANPNEMVFLMHIEAAEDVEEFAVHY